MVQFSQYLLYGLEPDGYPLFKSSGSESPVIKRLLTMSADWLSGQISGWISGAFVVISIHYGFSTHQADILAKPNGMNGLINAAFWQTTGYREWTLLYVPICELTTLVFNVGCYTPSPSVA